MLIGKPYSGLVIIELLSLGVTAEALRANIDWKSAFLKRMGQFGGKLQVEETFSTNHSSYRKTRCIALSHGV